MKTYEVASDANWLEEWENKPEWLREWTEQIIEEVYYRNSSGGKNKVADLISKLVAERDNKVDSAEQTWQRRED